MESWSFGFDSALSPLSCAGKVFVRVLSPFEAITLFVDSTTPVLMLEIFSEEISEGPDFWPKTVWVSTIFFDWFSSTTGGLDSSSTDWLSVLSETETWAKDSADSLTGFLGLGFFSITVGPGIGTASAFFPAKRTKDRNKMRSSSQSHRHGALQRFYYCVNLKILKT